MILLLSETLLSVFHTVKRARHIPNTFIYLVAFFMFSDAHATINTTAILFGKNALGMSSTELLIVSIVAPRCGLIGNYVMLKVQRRLGLSTKFMNVLLLVLLSFIPLFGIIGFSNAGFGLKSKGEMYFIGGYYGFLNGAIQSTSKVLFSELIPPGDESEFFSLYEITDKGSSWFGPLMVGLINDLTGELRYSFLVLLALLVIPIPFVLKTDVIKGKRDAIVYSKTKGRSNFSLDSMSSEQ